MNRFVGREDELGVLERAFEGQNIGQIIEVRKVENLQSRFFESPVWIEVRNGGVTGGLGQFDAFRFRESPALGIREEIQFDLTNPQSIKLFR